jgi:hypothetical protein
MTVNDRVPKRKAIPMRVKLEACLILLGFDPEEVAKRLPDFDHFPALGRRFHDGENYLPDQLDPRYLRPLKAEDHARKTTGRKGTSKLSSDGNGDTTQAAKIKRITAARAALLEVEERVSKPKPAKPKYSWPSGRKIESRGFKQRGKK